MKRESGNVGKDQMSEDGVIGERSKKSEKVGGEKVSAALSHAEEGRKRLVRGRGRKPKAGGAPPVGEGWMVVGEVDVLRLTESRSAEGGVGVQGGED